jgi:hypothetical protein
MWLSTTGVCTEVFVPVAANLQHTGQQARASRLPILLSFAAIHCSYCELLEEEFLRPMLLSGEYDDRIIMRKLLLDSGAPVTDFTGKTRPATRLSDHYRVYITPTLLFVDADGKEVAERIIGINTLELFGGYLDECIETALLAVRKPDAPEQQPGGCRLQHER